MKKGGLFLFVLIVFLITIHGNVLAFDSPLKVGWVVGLNEYEDYGVILHTKNGGRKWVVQGKWAGCGYFGKISAVDKQTAWAALTCPNVNVNDGMILHTTNGGVTWTEQTLPEGVGSIYGIKGLTRQEAWAVSQTGGHVLHTTDGGKVWNIVDLDIEGGEEIIVNRLDAIGYRDVRDEDRSGKNEGKIHANVWFVDEHGDDWGMIHTLYNGDIWRRENIPNDIGGSGGHMVSAYSPRVVWAAKWDDGTLYRTADGGETWDAWDSTETGIGGNDIDDMCAYSADALWLVQFQGSIIPGIIYHVSVEDGDPIVDEFHPKDKNDEVLPYYYGGLACVDDQTALVVGYSNVAEPKGIILVTNDGGKTWERQPLPVDDVKFWKVSFVGARR